MRFCAKKRYDDDDEAALRFCNNTLVYYTVLSPVAFTVKRGGRRRRNTYFSTAFLEKRIIIDFLLVGRDTRASIECHDFQRQHRVRVDKQIMSLAVFNNS